ncbi:MAG: PAS domain-containing protein, partial [Akkermansiaceae bacterium]|nr:PAS domain-containing protein [Verrucomicrobiales bacterium]
DAGTVRTDLFERIAEQKGINLSEFRVLNPQPQTPAFPFLRSTRLYPEWPFAALKNTNVELAQKVAIALLQMPPDSPAAKAADCAGWTVPLEYAAVHDLMLELHTGPYKQQKSVPLSQVLRQYRTWVLLGLAALIALIVVIVYVLGLNRKLDRLRANLETELAERKHAEASLQKARDELEERVKRRTADLAQANEGLIAEISERKRATDELKYSEQRFRQLAENIREVFWISSGDKKLMIYISPAFETIFGVSCQSIYDNPNSLEELVHPEDRARWITNIPEHLTENWEQEYRIVRPDGTTRWIRTRAFPVRNEAGEVYRIAGLTEDITDRRMLEDQLRQSQKMEAVGQLAGGVAHDFNNLLSIVAGCCDLLSLDAGNVPGARSHLEVIHATVKRGAALTRQLLAFSRRQIVAPCTVDLNVAVAEMQSMLHRLLGEHIELATELDASSCCIRIDPGQIEQVILNLCVNARDSMPKGGRLEIRTRRLELTPEFTSQRIGVEPGPHVALSVTDTGHGIDAEIKAHLFEPFFTTKDPGKGSGLGLSTVYGIVKHSGGVITVDSEVGVGSTFTIYFPLESGIHEGRPAEPPATIGRGVEKIL